MKLISMTAFVLQQQMSDKNILNRFMQISNYANFLKQPLELWMFVPCDDNGNVLEEPIFIYTDENIKKLKGIEIAIAKEANKRAEKYQEAKERCLFENEFNDLHNIFLLNDICTIESLIKYNLQLTPTAIKQLGL